MLNNLTKEDKYMKKSIIVTVMAFLLVVGTVYAITFSVDEAREVFNNPNEMLGGVAVGNEYYATSTAPSTTSFLNASNPFLIKSGYGAFGSYIVTSAGSAGGRVNFYDATTTNANLRTGQVATSSIIMTSLPTDLVAGTYVFDSVFTNGLIMDSIGTVGTSTITYR